MFDKFKSWVRHNAHGEAKAAHAQSGGNHAVIFDALRVLVCEDSQGAWFAQSIDIDYAATGESMDDVKRRFEQGLTATIRAHLEHFGSIDRLLKVPPTEEWVHLLSRSHDFEFSSTSTHVLTELDAEERVPFHSVAYIEGVQKAA